MGQSYRQLIAWQKSMDFVMDVYKVTKAFPRDELYGLATQLRRAAVAVPTNIADGQARFSPNEFFYFLGRARGALVEVKTSVLSRRTSITSPPNKASNCSTELLK